MFTDEWAGRLSAVEQGVLATGQTARCKEWVAYADGRKVLLDIVLAPLKGDGGATPGLIIVGRDVTEQDRLEDELRQAQKMEAVGRLAGGIAHDFNNLLTVVLGNLELVRSGAAPAAEADEMLAATERAARQAADLTKQMLGFAAASRCAPSRVDLNALVREAVGLLPPQHRPADHRPLPAGGRPAPGRRRPGAGSADPDEPCLNARDAMPEGGSLTLETANVARRAPDGPNALPRAPLR